MDSFVHGFVNYYMKRVLIIVGALSGSVGLLLLFSERFSMLLGYGMDYDFYGGRLAAFLLGLATLFFSLVYLQSGARRSEPNIGIGLGSSGGVYTAKSNRAIAELERLTFEFSDRIKRLEEANGSIGLSAEEKERVVAGAIESASHEAIKETFASEAAQLKLVLEDCLGLDRLAESSKNSVGRLRREISDLRLRSNINLLIGMAITASGLWLLWSTVSIVDASELLKALASQGQESDSKFFKNLILPIIPRVLLVLFVEVFAYFFLRLYRDGLAEIKYFQNELTNIESKLTAIEFAFITKNNGALKSAIEALCSTERNFVLGKGQTTVELEKAKSQVAFTRDLVRAMPKIFRDGKK